MRLFTNFRPAQSLTSGIATFKNVFDDRFRQSFPLTGDIDTPEYLEFAKSMASNLLGGIGYFYGDSIVDYAFVQEWDDEEAFSSGGGGQTAGSPVLVEPRGLLTATPSRSFFPRGFYWCAFQLSCRYSPNHAKYRDEGFHLLIVGAWDNDLR